MSGEDGVSGSDPERPRRSHHSSVAAGPASDTPDQDFSGGHAPWQRGAVDLKAKAALDEKVAAFKEATNWFTSAMGAEGLPESTIRRVVNRVVFGEPEPYQPLRRDVPLYADGWWGMPTIEWESEQRAAWIEQVGNRLRAALDAAGRGIHFHWDGLPDDGSLLDESWQAGADPDECPDEYTCVSDSAVAWPMPGYVGRLKRGET